MYCFCLAYVSVCSPIGVRFAGENALSRLFARNFFGEVALFPRFVRVSRCGLFFARLIDVQRSTAR